MADGNHSSHLSDIDLSPLRAHTSRVHITSSSPELDRYRALVSPPASLTQLSPEKILELVIRWEHSLEKLKSTLDDISDWGPFELVHIETIAINKDRSLRAFCWFEYHGAKSNRDHYEWNLKLLLKDFAVFDERPRHSSGDKMSSA